MCNLWGVRERQRLSNLRGHLRDGGGGEDEEGRARMGGLEALEALSWIGGMACSSRCCLASGSYAFIYLSICILF